MDTITTTVKNIVIAYGNDGLPVHTYRNLTKTYEGQVIGGHTDSYPFDSPDARAVLGDALADALASVEARVAEREAMREVLDALQADHAALQAQADALREALATMTAERDALQSDLAAKETAGDSASPGL